MKVKKWQKQNLNRLSVPSPLTFMSVLMSVAAELLASCLLLLIMALTESCCVACRNSTPTQSRLTADLVKGGVYVLWKICRRSKYPLFVQCLIVVLEVVYPACDRILLLGDVHLNSDFSSSKISYRIC